MAAKAPCSSSPPYFTHDCPQSLFHRCVYKQVVCFVVSKHDCLPDLCREAPLLYVIVARPLARSFLLTASCVLRL